MILDDGLVPVTQREVEALLSTRQAEYPITVPLRHARSGELCVDSTQVDAAPALAKLAALRDPSQPIRVGGPIQHTGARDVAAGPQGTGYHLCEDCGGWEFSCTDASSHPDDENGDGYSFPDYGARLDLGKIQALLLRSGLVTEYGAAQLAAWLDMEAYVLREVEGQ